MTKITKTLKLVIIGLIFLLGLHFTANFTHKDFVETFINEKKDCYDLLVKKGNHVFLYNSSLSYVPGVNPVQFNNLEEYTEYVQWERANGINCPVLFLQHEYDAQNNSNYKLRPSLDNQQGGLNSTSCNADEKKDLDKKVTAFNEVMKKSPSLAEELMRPVAYDRRGEIPTGQKPYMTIPVVNWYKGKLTCIYQREYIISAQRYEGAPKLTKSQIEAFDLFDEVLNDDKINLKMRLRPGDMQFVYNHSLFHDRTGFVDWPEPEKTRHLLRLWISLPGDRELPPTFSQAYGNLDVGDRGGVVTKETVLHAPLDA